MLNNLSFAIIICLTTACRSSVTTSLEPDLFEKTLEQTPNPQLVDVRTIKEYAEGHLSGAMLIDVRETTFDTIIQKLDKTRPVFVYCRSGKRSMDAAKILEKNKFTLVYNLEGGILSWKEKGKTVEQ